MSFLLDTHVFLWWLGDPQRIPDSVREQVGDPALSVWVSAVSAMEVATKTRLGKLPDVGLGGSWDRRLAEIGAEELPLTSQHALMAGAMPWAHREPFDRMLAAQAVLEGLTLVTADEALCALPALSVLRC